MSRRARDHCRSIILIGLMLGMPGCAATSARRLAPTMTVGDISHVQTPYGAIPFRERYVQGQGAVREAIIAGERILPGEPEPRADGSTGYDLLALSGGGSNGAFGAGLLCGWTQAGDRPRFQVVTGISIGSLLSCFAFAGPEFDDRLREAFTTVDTSQVYRRVPLFALAWSESLTRTDALDRLIAQYCDAALMTAIAEGHRQGRRLYVGTTHLDQQRLVIWDMGSLAACRHPGSAELFRRILRASSAIPVLFDPVTFEVVVDDRPHVETHVDGGARAQVFMRRIVVEELGEPGSPELDLAGSRLYVVVNGKLRPDPRPIKPRITSIAEQSLQSLMSSHFNNDLYRMFSLCRGSGMDFRMLAVPQEAEGVPEAAIFDRDGMVRLFVLGHDLGRSRAPWSPAPRGLDDSELRPTTSRPDAKASIPPARKPAPERSRDWQASPGTIRSNVGP